jgi:hypothetical protein
VNHTISFRRPDLRYVLSTIFVPSGTDVTVQIRRLQDLGYQIVDVMPPLEGYGPGFQILDVSPAHDGFSDNHNPRRTELSLARAAVSFRRMLTR